MALSPSTRIGQYEIQAPIGAGGMGEVYSALDTRLNRTVAVKVLPLALSNDSSYMQRFQREAQVLASLNHPHIAAIYGLEQNAIIMELVEGPTLADRGALTLDETIAIARQIAEALEYAHDKNVIHRDLKPGNVKITPAGVVKVLDFGLAKVVEPAPTTISANSPTLTMRATEVGVILGTASYMAPEQAAGKSVDKRADIWSFGVVLWEMLTGRRLFDGETVSHTLADVLRAPIDLDAIPAATPRAVRELVRRCLERDERKRLRDIGEARILLENSPGDEKPVAVTTRRGLPYWAAAVCLLPAAVMGVMKWREQPPVAPIVKFTIDAPKNGLAQTRFGPPRISPDGTRILMLVTGESGERQSATIWIRRLDAVQMQPLAGTEGATYPFWSGDGRHIGFFADGKLKRVAVDGAPPVTVCAAPSGRGGTWHGGVDGVIIFAANQQVPLSSVAASGGEPRIVTALDPSRKEASHRVPHFLPDGQRFLYIAGDAEFTNAAVYNAELAANGSKPAIGQLVVQSATEAMWASSGHLLYVRENTLLAQPFDPATLKLSGESFPLAQQIDTGENRHTAAFSVSTSGVLVFRQGAGERILHRLAWLDRQGKEIERISGGENLFGVRLSPDAKFAAGANAGGTPSDLWLLDLARGASARFTFDPRVENSPVWSPDGKRIIYRASDGINLNNDLLMKDIVGVGQPESLIKAKNWLVPSAWSGDGKWLFYSLTPEGVAFPKSGVFAMRIDGDRKAVQLVPPDFQAGNAQPSPNGRFFTYFSNESGRIELYVRTFSPDTPDNGGKWQISNGVTPSQSVWRSDGKEIYYVDAKRQMVAVPVQAAGASFQAGAPVPLFEVKNSAHPHTDGKRFLGLLPMAEQEKPVLNVILNWNAALPAGR